jgi:hypothetical protein
LTNGENYFKLAATEYLSMHRDIVLFLIAVMEWGEIPRERVTVMRREKPKFP